MKKVIYILIIVISFAVIFYFLIWPHLVFFCLAKKLDINFEKTPAVRQLEDSEPAARNKMTFFKVAFDVPWEIAEISTSTQRYALVKGTSSQEIKFDRHGVHTLFDTSRTAKQIFYEHFKDKKYYKLIDRLVLVSLSKEYKSQNDLAGFDLFKEVYNSDSGQINLFSSLEKKVNIFKSVLLKDILMYQGRDIFEFKTDLARGFQFDENKDSDEAIIYFFNEKNEWYSMKVKGVSQEEIDAILSSIEFVYD